MQGIARPCLSRLGRDTDEDQYPGQCVEEPVG